jgi:DNA-binding transcriptional MerR regulator/methylmalonyl-CoA mutase cobalamin-binding subunit
MPDIQCSIQLAAKKSGVTPHVIRIWEKRYDAVSPQRTGTNRRLYSERDINRLRMLGAAVQAGHRIGNIAGLSDEQLSGLVPDALPAEPPVRLNRRSARDAIPSGLAAIQALDESALEAVLDRALLAFGGHGLLANLIAPLAQEIGNLWRDGTMTAAHEHFATAVMRTFLLRKFRPFPGNDGTPGLISVTPAGQIHELGAVIVTAAGNDVGWNAVYLGASLPAAEIAGAAIQRKARAVALSIVYPPDDDRLPAELQALRAHLPESTAILVGGRAAENYAAALAEIGAVRIVDLRQLYDALDGLRKQPVS